MIISINQPAYLPWLGYFNRIVKSDLHVVLDHVQFEKNSFINRNKILLNQNPTWLTIPVLTKGKSDNLNINSLIVDSKISWKRKHWLSIEQAYSKSPYWTEITENLNKIYSPTYEKLNDILKNSLQFFIQSLKIETPIEFSSDYNFKQSKSDLILEICNKFKATKYISGPFGRDYLELDKFKKDNIDIVFDNYTHPVYHQHSNQFVPYLSCLDLIANYGKRSLEILTND